MKSTAGLSSLVSTKERAYYILMVVVSLAVYGGGAYALVLFPEYLATVSGMLVYIPIFALSIFFARGMMMGSLRGNAVHVTPRQLPKVHEIAKRHAATLGLKKLPEVFVLQSNGMLNAFATRLARASRSPYVTVASPSTTETASGVSAARAAKRAWTPASRG